MTIEEKAQKYADRPTTAKTWGIHRQALIDAYLAGATEALAGQWRKTEDETPEESEYVIIDGPNGIETAVWNEHYQVWDDAEGDDFMYKKDAVKMWMPIPEPPKDLSE